MEFSSISGDFYFSKKLGEDYQDYCVKCIFAFQPHNVYNVIMETLSDEGKMCIGTFTIERNLMVDLLLSAGTETGSDQLVFITTQNSCKIV